MVQKVDEVRGADPARLRQPVKTKSQPTAPLGQAHITRRGKTEKSVFSSGKRGASTNQLILSFPPKGVGLVLLQSLLKAADEQLIREQLVLIGRALTQLPASAVESCLYTM